MTTDHQPQFKSHSQAQTQAVELLQTAIETQGNALKVDFFFVASVLILICRLAKNGVNKQFSPHNPVKNYVKSLK